MTELSETPETVRGYLADPAIRTGVDALLKFGGGALPHGLRLDELGAYFTARGSAELTMYDMAETLRQLWSLVWGARLGPEWTAAPLEELIREDYAVTPRSCWEERSFSHYHRHEPHILYTSVQITERQTSVAFSIEVEAGDPLWSADFAPFAWRDDDEWWGWLVFSISTNPSRADFDISRLHEAANIALEQVERLLME